MVDSGRLAAHKIMRRQAQTAAIGNGFVWLPAEAPWLADTIAEPTASRPAGRPGGLDRASLGLGAAAPLVGRDHELVGGAVGKRRSLIGAPGQLDRVRRSDEPGSPCEQGICRGPERGGVPPSPDVPIDAPISWATVQRRLGSARATAVADDSSALRRFASGMISLAYRTFYPCVRRIFPSNQ